MDINYSRSKVIVSAAFIGFFLLCLTGAPATAQISYTSPADVKAETKKGKKEAARLDSEYEDHLEITKRKHTRGGVDDKKKKTRTEAPTDYNYDKEINAIEGEDPVIADNKKKKSLKKTKKEEK